MNKTEKCAWLLCGVLVFCSPGGLVSQAGAFDFSTHRRITETALTGLGFDADSIALVNQGDIAVDAFDDATVPEAHFDSETFSKGSQRLRDKLDEAMAALNDNDRDYALNTLGRGLHTAQDFFAHSNFVENNSVDTPVDLLNLQDPPADLVCDRATFKGGLTSGYYPDNKRPSELKCIHAEVNKDNDLAGERYNLAVAKATMETRHYVESLIKAIGTRPGWDAPRRAEMLKLLLPPGTPN